MAGFDFFNSKQVNPQEAALYVAAGLTLAYFLFNFPTTLCFGLFLAASFYALNDPKSTSNFLNRM